MTFFFSLRKRCRRWSRLFLVMGKIISSAQFPLSVGSLYLWDTTQFVCSIELTNRYPHLSHFTDRGSAWLVEFIVHGIQSHSVGNKSKHTPFLTIYPACLFLLVYCSCVQRKQKSPQDGRGIRRFLLHDHKS